MAKELLDLIEANARPYQDKSVAWLSPSRYVDHITPFVLKQNQAVGQRQRFSQLRFGSQIDLIVPLSARFDFDTVAEIGDHVKAGIDPIIKVMEKMELR